MIILLISLLIILGLCFLSLSAYLTYREFLPVKKPHSPSRKRPVKKTPHKSPDKSPEEEGPY